ncbi:reverse transcriptase domain-containing protein [Tanacetum coccineum]
MANNPNNVQGPPHAGPNIPAPDLHPIEELLQAPIDGVGDVIVVPRVLASQFELKIELLNLVTAISFHRAARTWLEKEPPNSITTWNDLVSKFVNRFFPLSRTTNLRNEIIRFQQRFGKSFTEAWVRFKDLLNKYPHHGFSPLHQIDTFNNGLNQSDQDFRNSAADDSNASGSSSKNDVITALAKQVEALVSSMNKPIHPIQEGCETCGGPHPYYECQAVGGYT